MAWCQSQHCLPKGYIWSYPCSIKNFWKFPIIFRIMFELQGFSRPCPGILEWDGALEVIWLNSSVFTDKLIVALRTFFSLHLCYSVPHPRFLCETDRPHHSLENQNNTCLDPFDHLVTGRLMRRLTSFSVSSSLRPSREDSALAFPFALISNLSLLPFLWVGRQRSSFLAPL